MPTTYDSYDHLDVCLNTRFVPSDTDIYVNCVWTPRRNPQRLLYHYIDPLIEILTSL